jgi:hypothetical protein
MQKSSSKEEELELEIAKLKKEKADLIVGLSALGTLASKHYSKLSMFSSCTCGQGLALNMVAELHFDIKGLTMTYQGNT